LGVRSSEDKKTLAKCQRRVTIERMLYTGMLNYLKNRISFPLFEPRTALAVLCLSVASAVAFPYYASAATTVDNPLLFSRAYVYLNTLRSEYIDGADPFTLGNTNMTSVSDYFISEGTADAPEVNNDESFDRDAFEATGMYFYVFIASEQATPQFSYRNESVSAGFTLSGCTSYKEIQNNIFACQLSTEQIADRMFGVGSAGTATNNSFAVYGFESCTTNCTQPIAYGFSQTDFSTQLQLMDSYSDIEGFMQDIVEASESTGDWFSTCTDCSYIRPFLPMQNAYVYSTSSIEIDAWYKVRSSDLQNVDNVIKVEVLWESVKTPYIVDGAMNYRGAIEQNLSTFNSEQLYSDVFSAYATGTHNLSYKIIEEVQPPFWQFWNDTVTQRIIAQNTQSFNLYAVTDTIELQSLQSEYEAIQQSFQDSQVSECSLNGVLSQACLEEKIDNGVFNITHTVPIGYATRIIEILSTSTATSAVIALDLAFPTSSPSHGKTLHLDISGTVQDSIDELNTQYDVTGAYDKAMTLWNLFWYSILIFWILKEILGTFAFDFSPDSKTSKGSESFGNDVDMGRGSRGWKKVNIKNRT